MKQEKGSSCFVCLFVYFFLSTASALPEPGCDTEFWIWDQDKQTEGEQKEMESLFNNFLENDYTPLLPYQIYISVPQLWSIPSSLAFCKCQLIV